MRLPATPSWVSLPLVVGVPRHSRLRAPGAVPRHSWLGSAGGGGVRLPATPGWGLPVALGCFVGGGVPCCVCLWCVWLPAVAVLCFVLCVCGVRFVGRVVWWCGGCVFRVRWCAWLRVCGVPLVCGFYKVRNPGHVLTAGGVQVEVRYYTRAYVRAGELVFRHHFKVLEILPDVVLGLPWLRSYNPTVNWRERYADIQHGSNSFRLSFGESRHSTQLQFQAASKLDLLSILSSSSSKASPVGNPTSHAKEHLHLHWSTHVQRGTDMYDESETEDGITDEECSDMEIEYISLPKLKREVRRSDLTGDRVFLCCMPRPAVPVDRMYKMQASDGNDDRLDPVRRKLPNRLHKWADLYNREKAEYGDLPPYRLRRDHRKYASIRKTIHRGYTLTKWIRAN